MFFGEEVPKINFVILSPEPNIGRLKCTVRSIRNNYPKSSNIVCSVEKSIKKPQLEEMNEVCQTFRGGSTITSLINKGMKESEDWSMMIIEGAYLPRNVENRYFKWICSEKDILFPIIINHDRFGIPNKILCSFDECTLNGLMIHKKFFFEVGKLTENPLKVSRKFWALDAIDKGAKFKAVLGVKIC